MAEEIKNAAQEAQAPVEETAKAEEAPKAETTQAEASVAEASQAEEPKEEKEIKKPSLNASIAPEGMRFFMLRFCSPSTERAR